MWSISTRLEYIDGLLKKRLPKELETTLQTLQKWPTVVSYTESEIQCNPLGTLKYTFVDFLERLVWSRCADHLLYLPFLTKDDFQASFILLFFVFLSLPFYGCSRVSKVYTLNSSAYNMWSVISILDLLLPPVVEDIFQTRTSSPNLRTEVHASSLCDHKSAWRWWRTCLLHLLSPQTRDATQVAEHTCLCDDKSILAFFPKASCSKTSNRFIKLLQRFPNNNSSFNNKTWYDIFFWSVQTDKHLSALFSSMMLFQESHCVILVACGINCVIKTCSFPVT